MANLEPILLSTVLFIVVWRFLSKTFFTPYLNLLDQRDRATVGATARTKKLLEESEALAVKFSDETKAVRLQALKRRDTYIEKAKQESRSVIDEATELAHKELETNRQKLEELKGRVRNDFSQEAVLIADRLKQKLLSGTTSRTIH
ncbi:hypothetical protein JNK13_10290 [bacterium]|nr:hypothetical protein [bacterium]